MPEESEGSAAVLTSARERLDEEGRLYRWRTEDDLVEAVGELP